MNKIKMLSAMYILIAFLFVFFLSGVFASLIPVSEAQGLRATTLNIWLVQLFMSLKYFMIPLGIFALVLMLYYAIKTKKFPEKLEDFTLLNKKIEIVRKNKILLFKLVFVFAVISFVALQSSVSKFALEMEGFRNNPFISSDYANGSRVFGGGYENLINVYFYSAIICIYLLIFAVNSFVKELLYKQKLSKISLEVEVPV